MSNEKRDIMRGEEAQVYFQQQDPRRKLTERAIDTLREQAQEPDRLEFSIADIITVVKTFLPREGSALEAKTLIPYLSKYPLTMRINGEEYITALVFPDAQELNPENVARGGLRRSTARDAKVKLIPPSETIRKYDRPKRLESFPALEAEPKREEIMEVLSWFREVGGKKWMTGDEQLFAERLLQLSRGEKVDFLIWNCIGLSWQQDKDKPGSYPKTTVIDNMDTAITIKFKERIRQMTDVLSKIGRPRIVVLVPTNEALADGLGIWEYTQPREEREDVIKRTVNTLSRKLNDVTLPSGEGAISVLTWRDYLQQAGAEDETIYTKAAIERLLRRPDLDTLVQQGIEHANTFFDQYGILLAPNWETGLRQAKYKEIYAAEGIAAKGNRIGTRNIVFCNLEEGTVRTQELEGADGDLAIPTIATPEEIDEYYKWKRGVIARRDK